MSTEIIVLKAVKLQGLPIKVVLFDFGEKHAVKKWTLQGIPKALKRLLYSRGCPWIIVLTLTGAFVSSGLGTVAGAPLDRSQILIIDNKDTPISSQVTRMYENLREIPSTNVLTLSLGAERQITPDQYWTKAAPPVKSYLEQHPEIRCIVTTSGVPYTVKATDGKDPGAAFDSELAAVLREKPGDVKRSKLIRCFWAVRILRHYRSAEAPDGVCCPAWTVLI